MGLECRFKTERLIVDHWRAFVGSQGEYCDFKSEIVEILTPDVTSSLPPAWGDVSSIDDADSWLSALDKESAVLAVSLAEISAPIGFLILYFECTLPAKTVDIRLGYLFKKSVWGRGLASELIGGLVDWCHLQSDVGRLVGGVASDNIASRRVLEKNGFRAHPQLADEPDVVTMVRDFSP